MNIIQLFYTGKDLWTRWRAPAGWTQGKNLFGPPKDRVAAATVPSTGILQLFYRATDNSIHSRWRNLDGSWSGEQFLGGILNGKPIAARVPGTDILQLFYRGTDNSIYTRWRNPDGSWSDEFHIGGTLNGDPIAAQVPGTNILQLFYRGTDNSIYTRWRNPDPDGSWSDEFHIGGTLSGDPIAAQVPGTDTLQLFYRGTDNSIYTRWRNPDPDGSWSDEFHIGGTLNGDPIAAQVPGTNILQLFYRGPDNSIYTQWRNPDGSWSGEQQMGEVDATINSDPVAAEIIAPTPASYTVVLMLWGPPQPPNQTKWLSTLTGRDLSRALTNIAGSTYFNRLAQYNIKQVTIAPGDPPQLSDPAWPPGDSQYTTLFTVSADIPNVIAKSFSKGIPSPDTFSDTIPIYIVITPRGGHATDAPHFAGEHSSAVWGPDNLIYHYAFVSADQGLNGTLVTATHEIVEAIGQNGGAPKELCDGCQDKYHSVSPGIDGYTVQSYFDAETNQCVAPPGFAKPA